MTGRSKRFPSSTTSTRSSNEIVDELEALGYVTRRPDLKDRRAKLITLTVRGQAAVAAGESTITGIEDDIVKILGAKGAAQLRAMLIKIVATPPTRDR